MISYAIQKGNAVYVYDEKNRQIGSRIGELVGYTGKTVTIKNGHAIQVYDERFCVIATQRV